MLKHFAPGKKTAKLSEDDLKHYTRNVPDLDGFHPGRRIRKHFEAVTGSWLGTVNNTHLGRLFEICVYDSLCFYGVPEDAIRLHVDASPGKHAEIDILVAPPGERAAALLLKTSFRERWKQLDRDAMIIGMNRRDTSIYALTYREGVRDFVSTVQKRASNIEEMCMAKLKIASILDEEATRAVFRACGVG